MIRLIDDYVIVFEGEDHYVIARIVNNDSDYLTFVDVNSFDNLHKAIEFARLYIAARILNGEVYETEEIVKMHEFLDKLDERVVE